MAINDLKKTQTTIVNELNTIFSASSLAAAFKSPNFQTLVEKQLNILGFLERKHNSKTVKSSDLLNKYNTLSGKHFNIDTNIAYTNDTALIDDANYLNIYLRNIYKVDVQALANGTKADIPNLTVNDAPGQGAVKGGFPFGLGGMMGNAAPAMQNQMMAAMAQAKIQQQAAAGEIYLYKDKPKYIPILKWIIFVALCVAAVASFFVAVGMLCSLGSDFISNNSIWGDNGSSGYRYESIMYFIFAIALAFAARSTIRGLIHGKNNKINENLLYCIRWQTYLFFFMLFIFVVVFGLAFGDRYIFSSQSSPLNAFGGATVTFGVWAAYIGYIIMLIATGIAIAVIVVGHVYSPKLDMERLNALTKQYLDEMSRTPPTAPPGAPGF